ncbi:GDSL-type esterase/lipase family protein, partial [Streptomyces chartreusis]|uniref:GDSL-type esterase/lipase family protein n=1 Tax=Streptomyces chartreusis TaxID=1969 RepID=UPI00381DE802
TASCTCFPPDATSSGTSRSQSPGVHDQGEASPHQYAPEATINGLKEFASQARTRAVRIVATTIPPYKGFLRYEAAGEHCRQAVNTYIRRRGLFDNVLDFDAALKDPADPRRLQPAFDSGDHLHPSSAGHHALVQSIDLHRLISRRNRRLSGRTLRQNRSCGLARRPCAHASSTRTVRRSP